MGSILTGEIALPHRIAFVVTVLFTPLAQNCDRGVAIMQN
jgi:hypothetical protein